MNTAKIELAKAMVNSALPDGYEASELCNGFCDECKIHDSECIFGISIKIRKEIIQFKTRKQEDKSNGNQD